MSAGVRHVLACSAQLPDPTHLGMSVPTSVPGDYGSLQGVPCSAIYGRFQILNHFSKCVLSSWRLYNSFYQPDDVASMFHINPLSDGKVRHLISSSLVEGLISAAISKTMNSKSHGPSVVVHRIAKE